MATIIAVSRLLALCTSIMTALGWISPPEFSALSDLLSWSTDFESGCRRSIAWIDEKGKCFFPKAFVGDDFDDKLEKLANPKIEIEIQIDNNNSVKRKREETNKEEPEVSSSMKQEQDDVLKRQRLNLPDVGTSRWPNARLLTEGEKVFSMVRDVFLSGMRKVDPGATITALHQCMHEGHLEKARYEVFQKQIEITRAARNASNTVYAWHGASAKGVETILEDGFGLPSNVSAPEGYGIGVYLSPLGLPHISAKMSQMDGNGEKHVLLCRVILGNVEKVEAGSQQNCPSSMDFDTGADEPNNPKWYVVWSSNMSRHIIPECVVSFKSSRHVQGQVKGPICMKYSFDKLFSKMRNLLPPTKIQEVVSIYDKFRAGALARHMFVKQLRLIAGDEVLLSIIREIHGPE